MKILQLVPSMDPSGGGVAEGILQTSVCLKKLGVDTTIVTYDDPSADWVIGSQVPIVALGPPKNHYGFTPRYLPWLRSNIENYDLAIANGLWNFSALAASLVLSRRKIPYFVFTHGMLDPWFLRRKPVKHLIKQISWLLFEGRLLSNANYVLFTTEEEAALARNVFLGHSYREHVVGYGTQEPPAFAGDQSLKFLALLPNLAARRFVLFLGRIHPKKGCDLLIEAFSSVSDTHPEIDIVIAGPDQTGLQASLMDRARSLGIAHRIHWPGMLSGEAKWGAFRLADAFILPSHQENFGIAVAEALACAKPVLITNKVNIWREIDASGAGLVGADDVDGIRNVLLEYLKLGAKERDRMSVAARLCFEEHFKIENVSKRLIEVIS